MADIKSEQPTNFSPSARSSRTELEAQRRKAEGSDLFNNIVLSMPDLLMVLNMNRQIIYANQPALDFLGMWLVHRHALEVNDVLAFFEFADAFELLGPEAEVVHHAPNHDVEIAVAANALFEVEGVGCLQAGAEVLHLLWQSAMREEQDAVVHDCVAIGVEQAEVVVRDFKL